MAATLFLSAAPVPYSRPKISSSVLSVQNILGFAKSLQRSRLRNCHTIGRCHVPRVPYQRKYDDEDQYVLFCNGRAAVYKEFAEYLNRVWKQRSMANKYYRKATEIEPCNHRLVREYAEFVWDELGDFKKAEEVYEQALQECPVDVDLVGGFAGFLWETEK